MTDSGEWNREAASRGNFGKRILPVHEAQLLTYLKLTRLDVGLLINFNVPTLRQGLRRLTRTRTT